MVYVKVQPDEVEGGHSKTPLYTLCFTDPRPHRFLLSFGTARGREVSPSARAPESSLSLSFDRVMDSRVTPTARAPSAPPTVVEGLEKSATT